MAEARGANGRWLKPGSVGLLVLLALLTAIGPLSTDMYLPSLPGIARYFSASLSDVQLTLSAFLAGFAGGQLIYGPLADRHGRKPVLLAGLAIYLAGSVACAMAPSIEALVAARLVQAIGACAPIVLARAIVRDLFAGDAAARMLSQMGSIMGLVPAVAPVAGGFLEVSFGWRASFTVTVALGVWLAAYVAVRLPETLDAERVRPLSPAAMADSFKTLLKDAVFARYAGVVCLSYGGLFSFISGSSFVLQQHYGLGEVAFGMAFSLCVLGYIAGTMVGTRFAARLGTRGIVTLGAAALATGGLAMAALVMIEPGRAWHVLAPMVVYMVGVGLTLPPGIAGAISPFPQFAGAASSLLGFLQMTSGALIGIAVGLGLEHDFRALAWAIAISGMASLLLMASAGERLA